MLPVGWFHGSRGSRIIFFVACGTVGMYGLANRAFVVGNAGLLAREVALNIIFGAIIYASATRFRFFEV